MVFEWNDGWRKHPLLSNNTRFNTVFPGFWWGAGAFAVYYFGKKMMKKGDEHDDHGHGAKEHGHH